MSHRDVIDDYVGDVVRALPPAMHADVGFELRELLHESLRHRAVSAGRPVDDALVLALLREFGEPAEVAARYHSAGFEILPAAEAPAFLRTATIGIAVQWALTLPSALADGSVGAWWLSWGLGALWWPGALIIGRAVPAWWRQGAVRALWRPRLVDRERVERGTSMLGLAASAFGAAIVLALPWLAPLLPGAAAQVLAFDDAFLRWRALPVVPLFAASFGVRVQALRAGRWGAPLRRLHVATNVAMVALLSWWTVGGPVFRSPATDAGAKGVFVLIVLLTLVDLAMQFARRRPPIPTPASTT